MAEPTTSTSWVDLPAGYLVDLSLRRPVQCGRLRARPKVATVFTNTTTNLPAPLTRFVGRLNELAEAAARLAEARVLTLTGPGGAGKTTVTPGAADSRNLFLIFVSPPWLVKLISVLIRAILPSRFGASHRVNPYISTWA